MMKTQFIQLPEWRAIAMVVLTVMILAFSFNIGMIAILALYALWFSHAFYKKQFVLAPSSDMIVPTVFTGLSAISFLWSDYPLDSLYKGAEYISMMLCTLIMFRLVPIAALIKGVAVSSVAIMLITLMGGQHASDAFSSDYALVGYFGSKNVVGFYAELGLIATLCAFLIKGNSLAKISLYVPFLALCAVCLYWSQSSSSLLSFIVVCASVLGVWMIRRFPLNARPIILGLGVLGVLTAAIMALAFNTSLYEKTLSMLGKDSTLTGRTYLWQEGVNHGLERPILGHGYSAFWVVGQPYAERYWEEFYITSKTGFHFHNLLIQTFVDLGIIGLILVIWMVAKFVVTFLYRCILSETDNAQLFMLAISIMLLVRIFVEVDFLGPFGVGPLLFFLSVFYSARNTERPAT